MPLPHSRYMAPGTPHYVFTTKDSFCVGGHYYCKALFSDTLRAITLEHFMGMALTNTQHSSSPFLCVQILASYCEALKYRPHNESMRLLFSLTHRFFFPQPQFPLGQSWLTSSLSSPISTISSPSRQNPQRRRRWTRRNGNPTSGKTSRPRFGRIDLRCSS